MAQTDSREQTQMPESGDVDLSPTEAQRLPRLRRCACCTSRRARSGFYRHRVVDGAQVFATETTLECAKRILSNRRSFGYPGELERVRVFEDGGRGYELIRDGRWVDYWQARYGRHAGGSRAWRRRGT